MLCTVIKIVDHGKKIQICLETNSNSSLLVNMLLIKIFYLRKFFQVLLDN